MAARKKFTLGDISIHLAEENELWCASCNGLAEEGERYCFICASYWADVDAGLFSDNEWEEHASPKTAD